MSTGTYRVTWTIDQEAASAVEAAAEVYRQYFGRDPKIAGPDDACVFTVIAPYAEADEGEEIDLSEHYNLDDEDASPCGGDCRGHEDSDRVINYCGEDER